MRTHRWLGVLAAALLASCADYGAPDEVVYGEAVFTQPKVGFDFKADLGSGATYFLAPQYLHFNDSLPVTDPLPANVKTAIDTNMTRLGYTAAATLAEADVELGTTVFDGTQAVYYPGGWCSYYYYYYCYYDYYYAGSYTFGAAVLEMTDVRSAGAAGDKVPVIWGAVVYGVASTPAYDTARVADGMNRAFGQSPYLDVK